MSAPMPPPAAPQDALFNPISYIVLVKCFVVAFLWGLTFAVVRNNPPNLHDWQKGRVVLLAFLTVSVIAGMLTPVRGESTYLSDALGPMATIAGGVCGYQVAKFLKPKEEIPPPPKTFAQKFCGCCCPGDREAEQPLLHGRSGAAAAATAETAGLKKKMEKAKKAFLHEHWAPKSGGISIGMGIGKDHSHDGWQWSGWLPVAEKTGGAVAIFAEGMPPVVSGVILAGKNVGAVVSPVASAGGGKAAKAVSVGKDTGNGGGGIHEMQWKLARGEAIVGVGGRGSSAGGAHIEQLLFTTSKGRRLELEEEQSGSGIGGGESASKGSVRSSSGSRSSSGGGSSGAYFVFGPESVGRVFYVGFMTEPAGAEEGRLGQVVRQVGVLAER